MSKKKKEKEKPEDLKLPFGGVDTHAHLDGVEYKDDLIEVLSRAQASGLAAIGNIFSCAANWQKSKSLFSSGPHVFFQLGIHPCEADLWSAREMESIVEAIHTDTNIRAIGEIGLDYYWDDQPRELQKEVFTAQLRMAKKLNLPVSIHCRNAEEDTMEILKNEGFKDYPLLWHCFGAGEDLAEAVLNMGWHISIPGTISFKKNSTIRELMPGIPKNKLHLETDSPYLTPEPWRGHRNEPAFVAFTAQTVSAACSIPKDELWLMCGENSKKLFGL